MDMSRSLVGEMPTPSLSEQLQAWRNARAAEQEVPPYIAMPNHLMNAIAAQRPRSLEELAALPGMGPFRMEQYGEQLLLMVEGAPAATDEELERPTTTRVKPRRKRRAGTVAWLKSQPFDVTVEYQLDNGLRFQWIDELEDSDGPICAAVREALMVGPSTVTLRVESSQKYSSSMDF
jgi:hypothetical protein